MNTDIIYISLVYCFSLPSTLQFIYNSNCRADYTKYEHFFICEVEIQDKFSCGFEKD